MGDHIKVYLTETAYEDTDYTILTRMQDDYSKMTPQNNMCQGKMYLSKSKMTPQK